MQNSYFGDIGDYGKYGLLRFLSGITSNDKYPKLSLGFMWYMVPDGGANTDGKFISYLNQPQTFSSYDPELFDFLRETVLVKNDRNVKALELSDLMPNSLYYDDQLVFPPEPAVTEQRRNHNIKIRQEWFNAGFSKLKDCDVLFLDPDTGLEVKSRKPHTKKGPKYVSREELRQVLQNNLNQTVVLYQHIARIKGQDADQQIESKIQLINELGAEIVYAVTFSNYSKRVYFIIPSHKHYQLIERRMKNFNFHSFDSKDQDGILTYIKGPLRKKKVIQHKKSITHTTIFSKENLEKQMGFCFTLSGGMCPLEDKIYLSKNGLVYKSEDRSNHTYQVHDNYIQPSEQTWAQFYQKLDEIGVWNWKDRGEEAKFSEMICDAGSWELFLERKDKQLSISDYDSRHLYPEGYMDFRTALKELILSTDSSVNLRML